jgi:hypothetical protein
MSSQVLQEIGSKHAHGYAQNTENDLAFAFLERHHNNYDEFLSNIMRVTGDEVWVSFRNVETREQ